MVPDTVPDLKKFCLYQTVKEYFKERLKHGGLELDYLNSISRYDRQAQQYILVFYGQSSIVCHSCHALVYFVFTKQAKTLQAVCCNDCSLTEPVA
jgi:hypothetical protein